MELGLKTRRLCQISSKSVCRGRSLILKHAEERTDRGNKLPERRTGTTDCKLVIFLQVIQTTHNNQVTKYCKHL